MKFDLSFRPKLFDSLKQYSRAGCSADLIAGFIISALGGNKGAIGGPTGAIARTTTKVQCGIRTPAAGVIHSLMLLQCGWKSYARAREEILRT